MAEVDCLEDAGHGLEVARLDPADVVVGQIKAPGFKTKINNKFKLNFIARHCRRNLLTYCFHLLDVLNFNQDH